MDGIAQNAISQRRGSLYAGMLGLAAAMSAAALVTVGNQGLSASRLALLGSGVLAAGTFSALVYMRPLKILILVLVLMTSPVPLALTLPQSALASAFLIGACAVGLALRASCRALAPDPMTIPIGLLALYGMASAAHGLWSGNDSSYVLGDCYQLIEFAIAYFLVSQLLSNGASIRRVLWSVLASILVTILIELVLFAVGSDAGGLLASWEGASNTSLLVRTIDIDATLLFTVLINLYPLVHSARHRLWIWLALIPVVANIALSLSRGLWVCTLVSVVASVLLQSRRARAQLLKASAYVGVCIVLLAAGWRMGSDSSSLMDVFEERIFHGVDQIEEGFGGTESMATRRFLEMAIVGPQVLVRPWFGHGLGATYVVGGFAVLDAATNALIDHHFIHNLYLSTAFRMGLVGLALLLWILLRYFRKILRAYRKMPSGLGKSLVAGLVAGLIGQLFLSVTQPTILDHPTCILIASAMAISFRVTAAPRFVREDRDHGR